MNKLTNACGRILPTEISGYGRVTPYTTLFSDAPALTRTMPAKSIFRPGISKLRASIQEAIQSSNLQDGMTISFHHHLRGGDFVPALVMQEIAKLGIKNLRLAVSSFFTDKNETLLTYFKDGTISALETSGIRGMIGKEVSKHGFLSNPIIFRTHGGRARAIEYGQSNIDVAFISAPICDEMGNMSGRFGKNAFGAMGYPVADAHYAKTVIAITDNLVPYPLSGFISINQTLVDYVVVVDAIGDPNLIATGATAMTKNPNDLVLARRVTEVLIASGLVKEGFSFQAGAGGASLAVLSYLGEYMKEHGITGSFASGGITSQLVDALEAGLFKTLLDTQSFDAVAARSLAKNPANHLEMSASMYANPHNKGCVAHQLDMMMLGATEIDVNFNINSLTDSLGYIMGALGGAPDTAAGAKMTVAIAPSIRKRIPIIVESVTTICTPGESVDVVVTDRGVAVNPRRQDLKEKFLEAGIALKEIHQLKAEIEQLTGKPDRPQFSDRIVGIVEYRDGSVLDLIYQLKS
ncbi:citrate lyase subunit alpha [Entomospira culicis]|uniref:Citrate lyase alpha chain n=1 Tax=Entomospira culicis TaxID=2719989 RepID=A0A968GFK7_9SPIO|nr:citrate lyase subunit alpha [Entomospira culicis]NIZ19173.1 citrate lyase subunit alpha [Entomospira culicis]NIZ69387.1 citrate lyase subunit alpha [Entomospira culicis]WDI36504.1 citrate lyase subunit alpha [Entomospira culicis]WDI38130.1 citrate lyase subunit alpha [Entomospira culicis]